MTVRGQRGHLAVRAVTAVSLLIGARAASAQPAPSASTQPRPPSTALPPPPPPPAAQPGQPAPAQPPPGFEPQPGAGGAAPQPPPGYGYPPPGYGTGYPPPGYGQPGYGQPGYGPPGYGPQGYPYGYPMGYGPAMLGPPTLPYEEGQPVPAGYRVESRLRKGLLIGGLVTFGSLYLVSAFTGGAAQDDKFTPLFVPIAGPFITIGTAKAEGVGTFTLLLDGVGQAGGALMAVLGLTLDQTLLVRNDLEARRGDGVAPSRIRVTPLFGRGTAGLGLAGDL